MSPDTVVIVADFSENYSFVLQDAVQGVHWNNSQATIHPFRGYYAEVENPEGEDRQVRVFNLVVVSDCFQHDTAAVYTFQQRLIHFLKLKVRLKDWTVFLFGQF